MSGSEDARSQLLRPGVSIYFVRHGQTDWNRDFRYQGQADIPLNALGRSQARRNGEALSGLLPAIVQADFVASPLLRAKATMEIIREALGLKPNAYRTDDTLKEMSYGHWEGHLLSELPEYDPEGMSAKAQNPFSWRPRGGESYEDLEARIAGWVSSINNDTVAVSHGGVSRVLRGMVLGLDRDAVTKLEAPQDRVMVLTASRLSWL